jgi:hypothetical protein
MSYVYVWIVSISSPVYVLFNFYVDTQKFILHLFTHGNGCCYDYKIACNVLHMFLILSRVRVTYRRVLDWMIGFTAP